MCRVGPLGFAAPAFLRQRKAKITADLINKKIIKERRKQMKKKFGYAACSALAIALTTSVAAAAE
ncbi:MAG: hypothetical protein WA121_01015, partial [Syntrophales bacterium]